MAFLIRLAASLLVAFLLYPVMFVIWNGPDRDLGYGGGMLMMAFVQFISPYSLWAIPFSVGTLVAVVWQVGARRRAASAPR